MKTILFVTKDLGAAKAAIPVALLARELGHTVVVFAEGKSIALWKEAGFDLYFEGAEFPDSTTPFLAATLLTEVSPDVVVATQSSPCFIENTTALAANAARIPVAFVEDVWGGHRRSKAAPALVVVSDDFAEGLCSYPTIIAGNPSVVSTPVSPSVHEAVLQLRKKREKVYVYAGGSPEPTTAELALLIECLKLTPGDWCLIPRFHPKHAKAKKDGRPYEEIWKETLAPFGERIITVTEAKSTDELAVLCDATFAAHSLCLIPAVKALRGAVSLWTPESEKSLKEQLGLAVPPLVALGLLQIREPQDLSQRCLENSTLAEKLQPFDASVALEAILAVVA